MCESCAVRLIRRGVSGYQLPRHGGDALHKLGVRKLPALDPPQHMLPLGGELGRFNASGSTAMRFTPFSVGKSCLLLRATKPDFISFSMMLARVGVCRVPYVLHLRSVLCTTVSIADSNVSSVKCLGGVLKPSRTDAETEENTWPSETPVRMHRPHLPPAVLFERGPKCLLRGFPTLPQNRPALGGEQMADARHRDHRLGVAVLFPTAQSSEPPAGAGCSAPRREARPDSPLPLWAWG